ncbi:hypothetical protein ALC56_01429 [Trachymyrmex septentrionalis]|uniref:Uncharacterized protein n=1 Tax=Trachymyrmex septentrionalis TaxID=34720 RepID=A0A195FUI3_9HYME|nr:hypothetical protein ALC56_01429 [Trachymyrmex septentrionalis]
MTKSKSKPPRLPDLNPLDYFLWGQNLKSLVYTSIENDLRNRIVAACEAICRAVCEALFSRLRHDILALQVIAFETLNARIYRIQIKEKIFNYSLNGRAPIEEKSED